jgi:hypothetical protein
MTKFYPLKHPHTQLWNIKSEILIIETFVKPFKYSTSATTLLPLQSNPTLPKSINLQSRTHLLKRLHLLLLTSKPSLFSKAKRTSLKSPTTIHGNEID